MTPRRKVHTAAPSPNLSSPDLSRLGAVPYPIGTFALAQCAKYTTTGYITTIMGEQKMSWREVELAYEVYGGIQAFLDLAKDEKNRIAETKRDPKTVVLGVSL